ncbi:MAG: LysM peptidoglycan-binding domain-containing protein [Methylococcales bacterium]|jgi:membrane-bound lytic murein transglycosylase D|nr:LysM peptidoglycan-binding domain-containing protein [Methylococcales bacterium]MBT7411120.1 LysM peptidoglycan-binding domain-containing protein [Methylococcales bacterium]
MPLPFKWLLTFVIIVAPLTTSASKDFPVPDGIKPNVNFWIKIYSSVSSNSGLIHDNESMQVIYNKITFKKNSSRKSRRRQARKAVKYYQKTLRKLATGQRKNLSRDEQNILSKWPSANSNTLKKAAKNVRFQLGQADRFEKGLIRSGTYLTYIRNVFNSMGLPTKLATLPHVESSFNPKAYSHVGAAGLWQFTRSTGKRFMRVDHVVDERLDPYKATIAAAQLLQFNYNVTKSWPTAITAYNHGVSGMRRAITQLKTDNIATIVKHYNGRTFGFASRNFYSEFIAAEYVSRHANRFFGRLKRNKPSRDLQLVIPDYIAVKTIQKSIGISTQTLKLKNPDLRYAIWNGTKLIPKGFKLRIPRTKHYIKMRAAIAKIPSSKRSSKQKPDRYYKIRRGDSLSKIAAYYRVKVRDLVAMNGLRSRHRIRIGQTLRLPIKSAKKQKFYVAVSKKHQQNKISLSSKILNRDFYIVKRGDSISQIANDFKMTEKELMSLNNIKNRHQLSIGKSLKVIQEKPPTRLIAHNNKPIAINPTKLKATQPAPLEIKQIKPINNVKPIKQPVVALAEETENLIELDFTKKENKSKIVLLEATENESNSEPSKLLADPTNYSVLNKNSVIIQEGETLGHYADWLAIKTQRLRQINNMKFRQPVIVSRKIKLSFTNRSIAQFEKKRLTFHQNIQSKYFEKYKITETKKHIARRGESLWVLSNKYQLPIWLIRQYNHDTNFQLVKQGLLINIPAIVKR